MFDRHIRLIVGVKEGHGRQPFEVNLTIGEVGKWLPLSSSPFSETGRTLTVSLSVHCGTFASCSTFGELERITTEGATIELRH